MHNKEEVIKAFLWMDANVEKLQSRIASGDTAVKVLADNYMLACSNPTSSLAWSLFVLSFNTLEQAFGVDWNQPNLEKESQVRAIIDSIC